MLRAIHKNELLISLLKDVRGFLDEEQAKTIDLVLRQFENDTPPTTPSVPLRSIEKRARSSNDDMEHSSPAPDEYQVSASVGSNEDLDFLEEDLLDDDERPSKTGYLGRNSQVQWMRTLQRKLNQPAGEPEGLPYAPPGDSESAFLERSEALHRRQKESGNTGPLSDYYFYLDNEELEEIEEADAHTIPPFDTAKTLFEHYRAAVHDPFRILDDKFETELHGFYQTAQKGGIVSTTAKWKAVFNLVLAIGARFSHLVGADWQADDHDHIVYMSRAVHHLGLQNITTLVCAPDSLLIQATGLFSFYYLVIGHVSKSWYMIGISLRYAQAAGLHLRNEDFSVPISTKRAMAQTWWALHSIECILTSITGRPRVVERKDCTVPLLSILTAKQSSEKTATAATFTPHKKPIPESSSALGEMLAMPEPILQGKSIDSFLEAWTKLDLLQHKTLSTLYAARTAVHSWKHMQDEIKSLTTELDGWALHALPHGASDVSSINEPNMSREYTLLYFYYQSVKICITRPCLCRLDRRIKGQSEGSANFNRMTATACVQAALDLSSGLPEPANPQWLYEKGPWWSSVHIIMQAITVLLLEIAQGTSRADSSEIAKCVQKLFRWLETMKLLDGVAERAFSVVCRMLKRNEQSIRNATSNQMLQDVLQTLENEPGAAAGMLSQAYSMSNPQYSGGPGWHPAAFNDPYYAQTTERMFDLNPLGEPLPDPYGTAFQFGQHPYPFFYGNFNTMFDQPNFNYVDDPNQEDAGAMGN